MPRVLIAGCGYVGQTTADLFTEDGWEVEGWTATARSAAELSTKPYAVRAVDISKRDQVAACDAYFDAIIQCVSSRGGGAESYRRIYLQGARNLLDVFPQATLLFTSSTSVYAQNDGSWVSERSAAEPDRETGKILRETEENVLERGGIVARLGGIYGPRRSALLSKLLSGDAVIDRDNPHFINQAHRDDIAAALFQLIHQRGELQVRIGNDRKIFNVVDDQPLLQSECYEWLAAKLGRAIPPTSAPASPRKRGTSNKRVSNAKLRGLSWAPRYPTFSEGMTRGVLPSFSGLLHEKSDRSSSSAPV